MHGDDKFIWADDLLTAIRKDVFCDKDLDDEDDIIDLDNLNDLNNENYMSNSNKDMCYWTRLSQ